MWSWPGRWRTLRWFTGAALLASALACYEVREDNCRLLDTGCTQGDRWPRAVVCEQRDDGLFKTESSCFAGACVETTREGRPYAFCAASEEPDPMCAGVEGWTCAGAVDGIFCGEDGYRINTRRCVPGTTCVAQDAQVMCAGEPAVVEACAQREDGAQSVCLDERASARCKSDNTVSSVWICPKRCEAGACVE